METVAFYSYKGGVGRTLLLANTAQFLAMSGRNVVVLDLDLEAPGLHYKLGNSETLPRARSGTLRGSVDALLGILENDRHVPTIREMAVRLDLHSRPGGSLMLIPAGSAPSANYWATLERLTAALHANRKNGGLAEAVLELQARIADELNPDFLLVDSRTGITELGGLATSLMADRVICMTTSAPESVQGTRVVSEALSAAPRLASQRPLRVSFLITRVPSGSTRAAKIERIREELGSADGEVAVLPHDSGIAGEERVLSDWRSCKSAEDGADHDRGRKLFAATLEWIAESFPGHAPEAEQARVRMAAVQDAWQFLTQATEQGRGWSSSRASWPTDQLREQVRFGKGAKSRLADIAVYDGDAGSPSSKLLMILEFVGTEDRDAVARWWHDQTRVPVVAILTGNNERRLYSDRVRWDPRAHHSDRWDFPLPHDFKALTDPTDVSVDALLDAVRRGHGEYLDRIITEWVRCSAAGLHGGEPWKPGIAKKIIDGLARVDEIDLARRVLWATSRGPLRRGMWLGDGDDYLDAQVLAELFAPLLWRLPPEAAVELLHGRGRPFGPSAGAAAIALLSRDLLGLRYDPDATFRTEGQRILDRTPEQVGADRDSGLYKLTRAFKHTEISFEISAEPPPLAASEFDQDDDQPKTTDIATLVSNRIAVGSLVTNGLLGDYQRESGRVVLYSSAIELCADKLALQPRHVGSVTLIHETLHALAHLGRDLDGRMWPEYALPDAKHPLFEPSWFHTMSMQFFTYHQILRLRDPALLRAFDVMSAKQAPAYRAWQSFRDVSLEDARTWFLSVRRGVGSASPLGQALFLRARGGT